MSAIPWKAIENNKVLTEGQRLAAARGVLPDFRAFCRLCGAPAYEWDEPNSGHNKLADALCVQDKSPDGRIYIHVEAPRDGGEIIFAAAPRFVEGSPVGRKLARRALKDGSTRIMYAGETAEKARDAGKWVLDTLTESNVTKVFGRFADRAMWAPDKFVIAGRKKPHPQPTWTTASPEKSTTGGHPVLIYVDDVETHKTTRTLDRMMKTRGWFDELQVQLEPGGEERVAGTRYDDNDLYGYISEQHEYWTIVIATVEDSTFAHLTPEFLAGQKAKMSTAKYQASYMNNPWPSERRAFREDQFIQCPFSKDVQMYPRYMLTDLAGSIEEKTCESALWVIALDAMDPPNCYCITLQHGHWDPSETMDRMVGLFRKWHPKWFTIEDRVLTKFALPLVRSKERETGEQMPYRVATAKNYPGKEQHILQLQPRFRDGRILFCDTMPSDEINFRKSEKKTRAFGPLVTTFTRFPHGKLRDIADALAYVDGLDKQDCRLCPSAQKTAKQWKALPNPATTSPWRFPAFRRHGGGRFHARVRHDG